jgi:hypothetical protein
VKFELIKAAWGFSKMMMIPKAIGRIATRFWNLGDHDDSRPRAKEVAMAKVIEFYIPQNFRRTTKWVPDGQRGIILELRPRTKKSA